ncbi:HEAT repeat domain-containing protein [Saccharothrix sp. 6-C]|uniref:HEAT repeat domain-containing protein n=1 Tax=Saccharothrix sp. 6-C TaxID=2781735 RepID=UPI00191713CC|nr:HEAT repeat domain-containing protein [Saccharothrix sp. 6-C]QQQ77828.1 HEAT repeat domain-containing protein [Saccharothrix sp. 6-C]
MRAPDDRRPGDLLVERLVGLESAGEPAGAEAYRDLYEHAHDRALRSDPAGSRWLVALTAHPNGSVRAIAVSALAEGRDPAHQAIMLEALAAPDPRLVVPAVDGLTARTVTEVFDRLVALVNRPGEPWSWARRCAARRIAESGHPRRLSVLAGALAHADHGGVHDIVHVLIRSGDPGFGPALVEHLRSRTTGLIAVAFALGHLRVADATGPLVDALRTTDVTLAVTVLRALGRIGAEEAAPAVRSMLDHHDAEVREAALLALARIGGPLVVPAALTASDDGDPSVRGGAIRVLAAHGDQRAVGRLAAACDGRHVRVALTGLVRLADPRVAPTLVDVLVSTTDRPARKLAGRALARIGARPLLPTWHQDRLVRRAAVWVVGQRADARDARVLIRALRDEDELVRARAAAALGRMAVAEALTPLTDALDDPRPRVRANAATALRRIAPPDLPDRLAAARRDPHPAVRAAATAGP